MSSSNSKSRKSFLIDSLLEERQRQLAAAESTDDLAPKLEFSSSSLLLKNKQRISLEEEHKGKSNGEEEYEMVDEKMPVLFGSMEEDEELHNDRNTSTHSPETPTMSPSYSAAPSINQMLQPMTTNSTSLSALAASVATSPFFNLFSKLLQTNNLNTNPTVEQPPISSSSFSQSVDYFNRLRMLNPNGNLPIQWPPLSFLTAAANSGSPTSSAPSLVSGLPHAELRGLLLPGMQKSIQTNGLEAQSPMLPSALTLAAKEAARRQRTTISQSLTPLSSASTNPTTSPPFFLSNVIKNQPILTDGVKAPSIHSAGRPGRAPRGSACGSSRSSNIKKYRCDVCDKTFSRSNTLITHKRIHTGEKPFRCEHCGRAFRQPGNLTRHRLTHTTVKPFVCTECDKAFNRASNLHTHRRTHQLAQSNWSVCALCSKSFADKSELKNHLCEPLRQQLRSD